LDFEERRFPPPLAGGGTAACPCTGATSVPAAGAAGGVSSFFGEEEGNHPENIFPEDFVDVFSNVFSHFLTQSSFSVAGSFGDGQNIPPPFLLLLLFLTICYDYEVSADFYISHKIELKTINPIYII
jgi:hypothetical protein